MNLDDDVRRQAATLEQLIPEAMRVLFSGSQDPLADMPVAQLRMVRLLYLEPMTVTSLADRLRLSASAITQIANKLESTGMVERTDHAEDRRVKRISLSPRARELMSTRQSSRIDRASDILSIMSDEERETLVESIRTFVSKVHERRETLLGDQVAALPLESTEGIPL